MTQTNERSGAQTSTVGDRPPKTRRARREVAPSGKVAHEPQLVQRSIVRAGAVHPLTCIIASTFLLYGTYAVSRHRQYLTAGYDLGIFDQAVRAYSQFRAPLVPLKGEGFNLLGDHFHPIIALLAPLYWLWDDPRMLLLAQAALIALSAIPVWRFARRRWSASIATLLTIGFLLGWPLQGMSDFDFHEVAFAVPLLAWLLDALDRDRDVEVAAAGAMLLLVREDMGAVVLVVGLLRAIRRRPRWPGFVVAAGGASAFVIITQLVIPAIAGTGYQYWDYSVLGSGPGDIAKTVLTHPWTIVADFFSPAVKTYTLIALFGPLLFLPLASPLTLAALPILAERFLADRTSLWTTEFHYNAPVWAILFIAALDGLRRVDQFHVPRSRTRVRTTIGAAAMISVIPVIATTGFAGTAAGMFPLARMVNAQAWSLSAHTADQQAALASIPVDTCVTADDRLAAHLTKTNRVTIPGISAPSPDYVLLDLDQAYPANPHPTQPWRNATTEGVMTTALHEGYSVEHVYGHVVVLQRASMAPRATCRP